jgi:hypothetical protein
MRFRNWLQINDLERPTQRLLTVGSGVRVPPPELIECRVQSADCRMEIELFCNLHFAFNGRRCTCGHSTASVCFATRPSYGERTALTASSTARAATNRSAINLSSTSTTPSYSARLRRSWHFANTRQVAVGTPRVCGST